MKFVRAALWGLALSALAALPAVAQTYGSPGTGPDGLYIRGEGGWSHMNDMAGYTTGGASYTSQQGEGYLVGGALGWKFDQLRVELGLDFSNSGIKSIDLNNVTSTQVSGEVHNTAGMVNFIWDMRTGTFIVPYVGMGVGASYVTLDNVNRGGALQSNSSDLVFAYQPMVGVNFNLTDQLTLGLQYRYFATVDPSFNYAPGGRLGLKNESHNVLAGLTWYFGVPTAPPPPAPAPVVYQPPPPAPAPAPAPAPQVFIVFFDFNQATLTQEGQQVVQQAAIAFQQNGATHIELTGYTDLTGSQRYNLDLSRRRAITVRDSLVQLGVPASEIDANWRGKEDPRVPTTAREPQNRRVEINIP
ncbi:MAG: OmpA family protein [Stellaceae bacterium]|jgi:outer membrane protein OmpA-like peptidoglycan-associated protein